jgi:hypothetical protein
MTPFSPSFSLEPYYIDDYMVSLSKKMLLCFKRIMYKPPMSTEKESS